MKTTMDCDGAGTRVTGIRPGAPIICWCCRTRLAADDECRVPEHAAAVDAVLSDGGHTCESDPGGNCNSCIAAVAGVLEGCAYKGVDYAARDWAALSKLAAAYLVGDETPSWVGLAIEEAF